MSAPFQTLALAGLYVGLEIGKPSDPVVARIALPYCYAGHIVTQAAAMRGSDDAAPFALLVLGSGQERTPSEEGEAAALAAIATLTGLLCGNKLARPVASDMVGALTKLLEEAKARVETPDRRLQ